MITEHTRHRRRRARQSLTIAAVAICALALPVATTHARDSERTATRGSSGATAKARAPAARSTAARSPSRATAGRGTTTARGTARQPVGVARGRATYAQRGHAYPYGSFSSPHHRWYGPSWYAAAYAWPYAYGGWGWPASLAYYAPGTTVLVDRDRLESLPAFVEIHVKPRRTNVIVDGEFVGEARDFNGRWDRLDLAAGVHVIELVADDRQTLRRVIDLRGGELILLDERLLDGEGMDPRSDAVPDPRTRRARAELPESRSRERGADLRGLRRGMLRLDVAPADAAVYLDGEFLAHAGELERLHGALPVAAGLHRLEVVRPGYQPYRAQIEVASDEPLTVEVSLLIEAQGR